MPDAHDGPISIVIADDHAVVRSGLRMLLDAEPDFEVVADAGTVAEARDCVTAHSPAVLVLDLHMPGDTSLSAMPELRRSAPTTRIVVLTMQEDPAFAREAMASGASAYVLKEAADAELVAATRAIARGGRYVHPQLGARLVAAEAEAERLRAVRSARSRVELSVGDGTRRKNAVKPS